MSAATIDDIRAWPATVDPATAATAFGISRSYAYELVRRGEFPAKVLKVGGRNRVITADIMRALEIPQNSSGAAPGRAAVPTTDVPAKDTDDEHATRDRSRLHAVRTAP